MRRCASGVMAIEYVTVYPVEMLSTYSKPVALYLQRMILPSIIDEYTIDASAARLSFVEPMVPLGNVTVLSKENDGVVNSRASRGGLRSRNTKSEPMLVSMIQAAW